MTEKIISVIAYAAKLKKQYDNAHIAAYSAEAAFFVLLSAVPMIMAAIILAGVFVPAGTMTAETVAAQLFSRQISGYAAVILKDIVSRSTIPLVSVTMVFLLWTATRGIRSIADGIKVIYKSSEQYNIVQLTVRSILYGVVMITVFMAGLGTMVFAAPLEKAVVQLLGKGGRYLLAVINMRNIILFLVFTLLFALAYKTLAKSDISFKNQLPGAMVASAGWLIYTFGYSVYIKYFSGYSAVYGSLGAVMLFMLWLYMCMNIMLCGALINRLKKDGFNL